MSLPTRLIASRSISPVEALGGLGLACIYKGFFCPIRRFCSISRFAFLNAGRTHGQWRIPDHNVTLSRTAKRHRTSQATSRDGPFLCYQKYAGGGSQQSVVSPSLEDGDSAMELNEIDPHVQGTPPGVLPCPMAVRRRGRGAQKRRLARLPARTRICPRWRSSSTALLSASNSE